MVNNKSRTISIRVSSEEYRTLRTVCAERGIANLSTAIRAAVADALGTAVFENTTTDPQHLAVARLQSRIDHLEEQLAQLAGRLLRETPDGRPSGSDSRPRG